MAKHKMIPPESHATDMVDERALSHAEVAEIESKQQMPLPLEEPLPKVHGRKAKVNMTLHSGVHLHVGKVPHLSNEDAADLIKNFPGDKLKKILE